MTHPWIAALFGGALIGAASALLLLTHGRIAGISGIVGQLVRPATAHNGWRLAFVGGLLVTGVVAHVLLPTSVAPSMRSSFVLVIAGLLVGVGTSLGSGCTSGHGVCGLARLSRRSIAAVATFMVSGAVMVAVFGGAS